jgi:hypothetical protein
MHLRPTGLSARQVQPSHHAAFWPSCRYHKHLQEFEARDASRRIAQNLPNITYPVYPANAYQPYSYYLPNTYRIDQFYAANMKRYKGGLYVSGGLADGDKSHEKK